MLSRKRIASTKELAVAPLEIGARNHLEFHHLVERRECKKEIYQMMVMFAKME